jgi:hypothetical protein
MGRIDHNDRDERGGGGISVRLLTAVLRICEQALEDRVRTSGSRVSYILYDCIDLILGAHT